MAKSKQERTSETPGFGFDDEARERLEGVIHPGALEEAFEGLEHDRRRARVPRASDLWKARGPAGLGALQQRLEPDREWLRQRSDAAAGEHHAGHE